MNPEEILKKEFYYLKHNPLSINGYTIELFNQINIYEWKITLVGAKDTPYADGIFLIKLKFPNDYPKSRPEIFFLTPIYHMNVRKDNGFVGVNFIYEWKEKTSVREILTKLYSIFYLVNPHSPYDGDLARLYKLDKNLYELNAKKFTNQYAKNNNENIKINFIINGEGEMYCINCNTNKRVGELIEEIQRMIGIHLINPLLIYEGKRLDESLTLCENGLKNQSFITIIHEVHY